MCVLKNLHIILYKADPEIFATEYIGGSARGGGGGYICDINVGSFIVINSLDLCLIFLLFFRTHVNHKDLWRASISRSTVFFMQSTRVFYAANLWKISVYHYRFMNIIPVLVLPTFSLIVDPKCCLRAVVTPETMQYSYFLHVLKCRVCS